MQMHVELFGTGFEPRFNEYFGIIRQKLIQKIGFEYTFRPEDFYIYMLAHEYIDYHKAGTGLRSVIDTYVFLKRFTNELDWNYIDSEMNKLGIKEFETDNRSLCIHLFEKGPLTKADEEMLNYIITSGQYGNLHNKVYNGVMQKGGGVFGMLRYIINRLILPMDVVKSSFPFFHKYKICLPFLPVYRITRSLKAGKRGFITEIKMLNNHNN